MKVLLVLTVIMAFSASHCLAGDEIVAARIDVAKKAAGFVAGVMSGFIFHEVGHEVVSKVENVDTDWSSFPGYTVAKTNDDAKLRHIVIAGFGAQVLSTEVILGVDSIPKDNAYVLGWLGFNIFNVVGYTAVDSLQKGGYGDFETLRNSGANTDLIKIGLLAHAALSAYRLYHNPKFVPYVSATRNEFVLGLTWQWN